jgi:hypothetical protein
MPDNKATSTMKTVRISEDGQPAPTHFFGPCPKCGAELKGALPAGTPKKEIECPSCHAKLAVTHADGADR